MNKFVLAFFLYIFGATITVGQSTTKEMLKPVVDKVVHASQIYLASRANLENRPGELNYSREFDRELREGNMDWFDAVARAGRFGGIVIRSVDILGDKSIDHDSIIQVHYRGIFENAPVWCGFVQFEFSGGQIVMSGDNSSFLFGNDPGGLGFDHPGFDSAGCR